MASLLGLRARTARRSGRARSGPEARISALCCATIRFSSAVMPGNSRMFWKVRATLASLVMRKSFEPLELHGAAVVVGEPHRAAARLVEAGDAVEHRGLAGAVRPDQRGDLAPLRR